MQRAVDDLTGNLRGFIEVVGGADAEQGVDSGNLFLDVGHVAPRGVEVYDLLGAHGSGPLGGGLLYLYGRERGLCAGVEVDAPGGEVDVVAVGSALRKRGERGRGGFQCLVPLVDDVEVCLCSGGGENIDNLLED